MNDVDKTFMKEAVEWMKELNFFTHYKELLQQKKKTTTVRIGDRSKKYRTGELVKITAGPDRKFIANGIITSVRVKMLKDVKDDDLVGESPDSITKNLLIQGLNKTYSERLGRGVSDEDTITIIKWEYENSDK